MIPLVLCVLVVVFFALGAAAMRWGWRNRQRPGSYLPALPAVPDDLGDPLLPEATGRYVWTTTAGNWQDRIAVRTGRAMAGTVMGVEGLLVITWLLGEHRLDTGFRGDDKEDYGSWIDAIAMLAGDGTATAGARGGDER